MSEVLAPTDVEVTVTTIRLEDEDGVREATVTGPLDTAVRQALDARLVPWAADQVYGQVLSKRPAAGTAAVWQDSFTPERRVRVHITPACPGDAPPPCKTHRLPGLFLPPGGTDEGSAP